VVMPLITQYDNSEILHLQKTFAVSFNAFRQGLL